MERPQYLLTASSDFSVFEFKSNGKDGITRKAVKYTATANPVIYNLSFGDVIGINRDGILLVDDTAVSGDRDMVLNTVAGTIIEFTARNPDIYVIFRGSTASRTRLYRRAMTIHYEEISKRFNIFGVIKMEDGTLERTRFDSCVSCYAYLIKRK